MRTPAATFSCMHILCMAIPVMQKEKDLLENKFI